MGATPAGDVGFHFAEMKLETRYRFSERGEWPVDLELYGEGVKVFGEGTYETEAKIIAAKDFDQLTVVANAGFTPHWLELFKRQLERVGTHCVVHRLPFPALVRALRGRSFEAALIGFPGFVDPDRVLFDVFHSAGRANYSGVSDPGFDDFVDRARRSHAAEERAELYARACAVLEDLAPAVFLRHGVSIIARRSRVTGVDPHPLGDIDLAKASWRS